MEIFNTKENLNKATQKKIKKRLQYAKHGEFKEPKQLDESKYYVILINGKRIETRSNKKCWSGFRGARIALFAYLSQVCDDERRDYWRNITISKFSVNYYEDKRIFREALDDWVEQHVRIISLKEYNDMIKKRSSE